MCNMYSYWKVKFEIKITRCFYDSYVSFDEVSPCLLQYVYEVLISFFWVPQRVKQNYSGPTNLDTEQDPVEVVDTHI